MRRALLLAPAAVLAAVPAAHGATLMTARTCYLQTDKAPSVEVAASGFAPGRPYSVALDGAPLPGGTGQTDDAGAMSGKFGPALATGELERTFQLAVSSDDLVAATAFTVTRFRADFTPTKGNPATLRVRFSAFGFGLVKPQQDVYVHYVRPNGRLKRTVRLGRAAGQCGSIARTNKRRLFPFALKRSDTGRWKLQFDTSKTYKKGTARSDFLFYTLAVPVKRRSS